MIPDFFQFHLPTKVLYQPGISKDFSNELSGLGLSRLLVITDPYLVQSKLIDPILEGLQNGGVEKYVVFSDVPPNSEVGVVKKACEKGQEIGAEGILAIGGGSVMDTAKAANILLSQGGDLVSDYSGAQTLTSPLKPLIVIPTTSGTGSEVTKVAVILDESRGVKLSFLDRYLYPTLSILDPELTLSLPPKLTAMTGMDALTHAIEAYTSLEANPFSDALSFRAITLINHHLAPSVQDGSDLSHRGAMLTASNLAGVAFDHAMVGIVHSMSHATGGVSHVAHGLANSILLPWGMEYNFESSFERYAQIAPALGISTVGISPHDAAQAAIQKVRELKSELKKICGLADTLREAGVKKEDLTKIAVLAVEDGSSFYNPCEVIEEKVLETLNKAY